MAKKLDLVNVLKGFSIFTIDHYIHLHLLMHLIICFLTSYIIAYIYSIVLKKAHLK